jgi:hypothetical protein
MGSLAVQGALAEAQAATGPSVEPPGRQVPVESLERQVPVEPVEPLERQVAVEPGVQRVRVALAPAPDRTTP